MKQNWTHSRRTSLFELLRFIMGMIGLLVLTSCNFNLQKSLPQDKSATAENDINSWGDSPNFQAVKTKVFDVSCKTCHTTVNGKVGKEGGVNYDSYETTKQFLVATRAEVFGGTMPPSWASAKISRAQADFLILWIDRGAPEF